MTLKSAVSNIELESKVLVSTLKAPDTVFDRKVIFILLDANGEHVGIFLNSPHPLYEEYQSNVLFKGFMAPPRDPLLFGGYVEQKTTWALTDDPRVNGIGSNFKIAKLEDLKKNSRLYFAGLGFCHWGKDQLRREIALGYWEISSIDIRSISNLELDNTYYKAVSSVEGRESQQMPPSNLLNAASVSTGEQDDFVKSIYSEFDQQRIDFNESQLIFSSSKSDNEHKYDAIIIGHSNTKTNMFSWGWATGELPNSAKVKSLVLKQICNFYHFEGFGIEGFNLETSVTNKMSLSKILDVSKEHLKSKAIIPVHREPITYYVAI